MSILTKKLYIKKGSTVTACNIYSTAAEAGDRSLKVKVDNATNYVALKPITDANATAGRVSIGGVTYAIATKHESGSGVAVPYTENYWTEAGSHSFTVPTGITRIRVAVCGGGGGKGGLVLGGNGGDSSAFGLTATGGRGGWRWGKGMGGEPNGLASSGNSITNGFLMSFDMTAGTYGRGGQYSGSGGYDSQYVAVNAGQSYAITVGGAGGTGGTGGFVLIAYGGDI
jgi:hypothetical protein